MFLHRYYEIEMHDAGIPQVSILYPTSHIVHPILFLYRQHHRKHRSLTLFAFYFDHPFVLP